MFIFKNKRIFSVLYFSILLLDIILKLNIDTISFRLITKPFLMISLLVYYIINHKEKSKNKFLFMIIALSLFLVGDILFIFKNISVLFTLGMFSFVLGKLFFAFKFSNQNDFKLIKLFPILSFCFIYILIILNIVYDKLEGYFFPVLFYLFVAMLVLQFAYLRKSEVDRKSYLIVGLGVLFSVFSDSISVLHVFYSEGIFYEKVTVILLYGISQYLIVTGIVSEKIIKKNKNLYEDNILEI
ncbi:lysoplasmalogenase family protein [Oceanihabitans sp. 2_MG-2023]|uniref:lysoplasmalogenase family protein n=1 Tax=Oceanihabitans sp. 2_MG-2023 TaxID=3062661 RepID=UPI0026E48B50|nr:lysoplasmalogenase family protein [Oceanihabitans sp. 2_MG-2023]MDO6597038.1 lysoplasmalogenase family protein [Oceanihabitans sp. 2_MG-2023]